MASDPPRLVQLARAAGTGAGSLGAVGGVGKMTDIGFRLLLTAILQRAAWDLDGSDPVTAAEAEFFWLTEWAEWILAVLGVEQEWAVRVLEVL